MTSPHSGQPPKAKKQKREKPVLEPIPDDGHPGNSKFARSLASVDYLTREKGLQSLKGWLLRKTDLKELDMMKIWKGLFYCFWHSDKAPVQAELAERLAAILTQLPEQSAFLYFTAFMATMRREWFGIDRLRMDKFLMLIRKFVHHMLACLKAAKWHGDLVQRYASYLQHHVVLPSDTLPAAGVAFHCGDVLLEELRGVADGRSVPGSALAAMLEPFAAALQNGEQVVLHRIGDGLFDTLMSELGSPTDDSPYLRNLDVASLATQLFERGAAAGTRARNRQVLYDLSRALERLQRKRQRVDDGAKAGPSHSEEPTGKRTKKKLKEKKKAEAAAAAVAAAAVEPATVAANGDAGHDAEAAAPSAARQKRKAKALDTQAAPDEEQPASARAAADGVVKPGLAGRQKLGKKKRSLKEMQQQQPKSAAEEEPAAGPASAVRAAVAGGRGAAAARKEPTSGQKAALRAAVAKLAATANAAAAAAAAATPKAKKDASQQDGLSVKTTAAPQLASTPAPATDGKSSALGKRAAPGSCLKMAPATGHKQQQGNGAAEAKTPVQAKEGGRTGAASMAKKGRVVINLKKNLYFEHGGPVPDPDIRTPPPARAKGGILKKTAQSCPPKVAPSCGPASAAKHQRQAASAKKRVLPKQARRASAALFF